jgi:hypothetical protein
MFLIPVESHKTASIPLTFKGKTGCAILSRIGYRPDAKVETLCLVRESNYMKVVTWFPRTFKSFAPGFAENSVRVWEVAYVGQNL